MNQIWIVGNVGQDPTTRFTQAGKAVTTLSVATTRGKDDKKETTWHDVVCFDDLAENVSENVTKGSRVVVVGRLNKSNYETREGEKRTKVEIVADEVSISLRYKKNGFPAQTGRVNEPPEAEDPF